MCGVTYCEHFKGEHPCVDGLWSHEITVTDDEEPDAICTRCGLVIAVLEHLLPNECALAFYPRPVE